VNKPKEEKGRLVHTRGIDIHTYDLGDHLVLIEGKLRDTRNGGARLLGGLWKETWGAVPG